jgi:hypothetical protein
MSLVLILGGAHEDFEMRLEELLNRHGFDSILAGPSIEEDLEYAPFRLNLNVDDRQSLQRGINLLHQELLVDEIDIIVWVGPPRLVGNEIVQFRGGRYGPTRRATQNFLYRLRRHMSEGVPDHPRHLIVMYLAPRIQQMRENEASYAHSQVLPLGWPELFDVLKPNQQFVVRTGLCRVVMPGRAGFVNNFWYYNVDDGSLAKAAIRLINLLQKL